MSASDDQPDPTDPTPPGPPAAGGNDDDGGDDDGPDDGGDDAGSGEAAAPGQPGAPQGPGMGMGGRKRRRRRRRKGSPIFFAEDGQAYRKVIQPDGQVVNVFLTAVELEQYKQRQQQQQAQAQQQLQQRHAQATGQPVQMPVQTVEGVLDLDVKGQNAALRSLKHGLLPRPDDPEIPKNLVQKLRLRAGQLLTAKAQMKGLKGTVVSVDTVEGMPVDAATRLPHFQDLTSIDPVERINLASTVKGSKDMVARVLDLIAPLGKGQRALITAPPKTGKTIILQRMAQAILANHPEIYLMVVLIDERPEEVTDMKRSIKADVLASSSDQKTVAHLRLAELALERARRMVETGKDVVVLLDSITRLARSYNKEVESSGRTMSGGVDSRALEKPKRIFGSARATEEAGTLTIVGTALIDTGSRMDEVIFEEFKGTGNSEVTLDRLLAEKRIWPAINIAQSGTRKEEKLFQLKEFEKVKKLRQMLFQVKPVEAMEALLKRLSRYDSNDDFLSEL